MKSKQSFWCETCGGGKEMSVDEAKSHLKDVHKIEEFKGSKKAIRFLDGKAGWYQQTYQITVDGGVNMTQVVEGGGR